MTLSSRISSLTGPDRAVDDKQFLLLAGALSVLLKEIVGAGTFRTGLRDHPFCKSDSARDAENALALLAAALKARGL